MTLQQFIFPQIQFFLRIVFLDPKTLHEKNLDIQIQYGSTITTTFIESLVLLDGATELYG